MCYLQYKKKLYLCTKRCVVPMTYLILLNVCTLLLRNTLCMAAQIPFRMFNTVCMWIRLLSTSQCGVHTSMTLFLHFFFFFFSVNLFSLFSRLRRKNSGKIIQIMVVCMCSVRSDLSCFLCVHHYWRVDNCVESKMVEFVFLFLVRSSSVQKQSVCVCVCVCLRACMSSWVERKWRSV